MKGKGWYIVGIKDLPIYHHLKVPKYQKTKRPDRPNPRLFDRGEDSEVTINLFP